VRHWIRKTAENRPLESGHTLDLHIAALQRPLVVLFEQDGADQSGNAVLIGEDDDDVGPPFDFARRDCRATSSGGSRPSGAKGKVRHTSRAKRIQRCLVRSGYLENSSRKRAWQFELR